MTSPAPQPINQYITLENIYPMIGKDKVAINDNNSFKNNGIPRNEAEMELESGVSMVIMDLEPFYVTDPTIETFNPITGKTGDWLMLLEFAPNTYSLLFNAFRWKGASAIIRNFITRNTDSENELYGFVAQYDRQYENFVNRLHARLPNGAYKFPLTGLKQKNTGIQRTPKKYVSTGNVGTTDYVKIQQTDPQYNWQNYRFGYNNFNRG